MARRARPVPLERIRLLVLDVDGVLTDGRLYYGPDGEFGKSFHTRDGYGIKSAQAAGIEIVVISGRNSIATHHRCVELGIAEIHQGAADKAFVLADVTRRLGVTARECACVGDDLPEAAMFRIAGLAVAVADAHPALKVLAHRRTRAIGGHGAVREVCDWLIAARRRRLR